MKNASSRGRLTKPFAKEMWRWWSSRHGVVWGWIHGSTSDWTRARSEAFWDSMIAASRTENWEVMVEQSCTGVPCAAESWALWYCYRLMRQLPDKKLEFSAAKVLMENNTMCYVLWIRIFKYNFVQQLLASNGCNRALCMPAQREPLHSEQR